MLSTVLPAWDFPWNKGSYPAEKIFELNQWIKSYASQNNHIYLEYYSSMVDERKGLREELTYDGVHPDADGYSIMEPLVEKAIREALGK